MKAECPFCGASHPSVNKGDGWVWVECDACHARGPRVVAQTRQVAGVVLAVYRWNEWAERRAAA